MLSGKGRRIKSLLKQTKIILIIFLLFGSIIILDNQNHHKDNSHDSSTDQIYPSVKDSPFIGFDQKKSSEKQEFSSSSSQLSMDAIPYKIPSKPVISPISSISEPLKPQLSDVYSSSGVISITSDSDLTSYSGSGTYNDPYVISDLNITLTDGLYDALSISNTRAHVLINHTYFNIITQNAFGIYLSNATNVRVTYCEFANSSDAIRMANVNDTIISHNNIYNALNGVSSLPSTNATLSFNYIANSSSGVIARNSYDMVINDNVLTGLTNAIYLQGNNNTHVYKNFVFSSSTTNGIYIVRASDLTPSTYNMIESNYVAGGTGVYLTTYSEFNTVKNNTLINSDFGVRIVQSSNNNITSNVLQNGTEGIYLESQSTDNNIENNIIYKLDAQTSDLRGMYLSGGGSTSISQSNYISNNTIVNATSGLYMYNYFQNNKISNNTIFATNNYGILAQTNVQNNIIANNTISNAKEGIRVQIGSSYNTLDSNVVYNATSYGLQLLTTSEGNTVKNNYFSLTNYAGIFSGAALNDIYNNDIIDTTGSAIYISAYSANVTYNNIYNSSSYAINSNTISAGNYSYNYVSQSYSGIYLYVTSNSIVYNNEIRDENGYGIFISQGSSNKIRHNIVYNSSLQGTFGAVTVVGSNYNVLENNSIGYNKYHGLDISSALQSTVNFNNITNNNGGINLITNSPTTITYNNISNNGDFGIQARTDTIYIAYNKIINHTAGILFDTCNNNQVNYNTFIENYNALYIVTSSYNSFSRNTIMNSASVGIYFDYRYNEYTTTNNILNNTLFNNTGYGILIPSAFDAYFNPYVTNILIEWNDFVANNNGNKQAYDAPATLNTVMNNFWNDLGSNSYYTLDGGDTDNTPVLKLINIATVSFLTPVAFTNPLENSGTSGLITLAWTKSVDSTGLSVTQAIYYSSDGVFWIEIAKNLVNSSLDWDASFLTDGIYKLKINATNGAGDFSEQVLNSFSVDKSAPQVVSAPAFATFEYNIGIPQYCFVATDDNPDSAILYNVDMGGSPSYFDAMTYFTSGVQTCLTPRILDIAGYNYEVQLKDKFGSTTIIKAYLEMVDTTAPQITSSPGNIMRELGNTGTITWNFNDNARDLGLGLQIIVDTVPVVDISTTSMFYDFDLSTLSLGSHDVSIKLTDIGGQVTTDYIVVDIVDTTDPVVIESPNDISFELGSIGNRFNYTLTDINATSYEVLINDVYNNTGTWESGQRVTLNIDNLPLGVNNFTVVFFDYSSNPTSITVNVTVYDTLDPIITRRPASILIEYGSTGNIFSYTATDYSPWNYTLYVNESVFKSANWTSGQSIDFNFDGFEIGIYNVSMYLMDLGHNLGVDWVLIEVKDTTSPLITTAPSDFSYEFGSTGNKASFAATDLAPNEYSLFIDGNLVTTGTWVDSQLLEFNIDDYPTSTYTMLIEFTDTSGNIASISVSFSVVDTTNPAFTQNPDNITTTAGSNVVLSWTATDLQAGTYKIFVDGVKLEDGSWTNGETFGYALYNVEAGTYEVKIVIYDSDGNSAQDIVNVTVTETVFSSNDSTVSQTTSTTTSEEGNSSSKKKKGILNPLYFFLPLFIISIAYKRYRRKDILK